MKSLVALWLGVEGLTDQPAAIGHTEGWSAIARGLCGVETSDATLREGSRLKAGGFRSGRGVPLAHAPVLSDPSVEEGGDVGARLDEPVSRLRHVAPHSALGRVVPHQRVVFAECLNWRAAEDKIFNLELRDEYHL